MPILSRRLRLSVGLTLALLSSSALGAARVTVHGFSDGGEVQRRALAIVKQLSGPKGKLAGDYRTQLDRSTDGLSLTATYFALLDGPQNPELGFWSGRIMLADRRRIIHGDGAGQASLKLTVLINELISQGEAEVSGSSFHHLTYQLALVRGQQQALLQLCTDWRKCNFEPYAPVMYFGPAAAGGSVVGQNYQSGQLVTLSGEQDSYDPVALKAAYALFGLKGSF
jgi:hypothetical protein